MRAVYVRLSFRDLQLRAFRNGSCLVSTSRVIRRANDFADSHDSDVTLDKRCENSAAVHSRVLNCLTQATRSYEMPHPAFHIALVGLFRLRYDEICRHAAEKGKMTLNHPAGIRCDRRQIRVKRDGMRPNHHIYYRNGNVQNS